MSMQFVVLHMNDRTIRNTIATSNKLEVAVDANVAMYFLKNMPGGEGLLLFINKIIQPLIVFIIK